jgi:ribosomal protein L29
MKRNDIKELRLKTVSELQKHLKDGYEILSQLKMDQVQNKVKDTSSLTNTRKNIAVIKTIVNEKLRTKEEVPSVELEK